ncbi:MAG: pentapeptide repeat-containing protein [Pseudanabaenaceae cyanobacterium bins.39]|nr:pentapeptide repeat-containing protein [Pseudanabaenaceae cyanobacterium bins.39]
MASQQNQPQKNSGANDPQKASPSNQQGLPTDLANDAANVDWMIISDFSTRIGLEPQTKTSQNVTPPPAKNNQSQPTNPVISEDLEDLEWLQSIGLDDEILPSTQTTSLSKDQASLTPPTTGVNTNTAKPVTDDLVENIDWLIVSDLKTRMDEPSSQIYSQPSVSDLGLPNDFADLNADFEASLDLDLDLDDNADNKEDDKANASFEEVDDFSFLNDELNELNELGEQFDDGLLGEVSSELLQDSLNELDTIGRSIYDSDLAEGTSASSVDTIDNGFEIGIESDLTNEFADEFNDEFAESWDESLPSADLGLTEDFANDDLIDEWSDIGFIEEASVEENLEPSLQELANSDVDDLLDDSFADALTSEETEETIEENVEANLVDKDNFDFEADHLDNLDYEPINPESLDLLDIDQEIAAPLDLQIAHDVSHEDAFAHNWESPIDTDIDDSIWDSNPSANDITPDLSGQHIDNAFADPFSSDQDSSQEHSVDGLHEFEQHLPSPSMTDYDPMADFGEMAAMPDEDAFAWSDSSIDMPEVNNWDADFATSESIDAVHEFGNSSEDMAASDNLATYDPEIDLGELENALANDSIDDADDWHSDQLIEQVENDFVQDYGAELQEFPEVMEQEPVSHDDLSNSLLEKTAEITENAVLSQDVLEPESLTSGEDIDYFESALDEDFDLESFDEAELLPLTDSAAPNITTTLSPNRKEESTANIANIPVIDEVSTVEDSFDTAFNSLNDDIPIDDADPFEEQLASEVLRDRQASENDFIQDAMSYDVLGDIAVDSHDYLDNFDLEDLPLGGDMALGTVSNHEIAPPPPPIIPHEPVPPPMMPRQVAPPPPKMAQGTMQEPTVPTLGKDTKDTKSALPMGLPPLPPKRQPMPMPVSQPLQQKPPQQSRNIEDFDSFHKQSYGLPHDKGIDMVDQGWTDLLDAETVISGMLQPPTIGSDSRGTMSPRRSGNSMGSTGSQNSSQHSSQNNSHSRRSSKKSELPNLEDLAMEAHDDNTDWSGLLESGDLSDSITTISNVNTPVSSRRIPTDMTGVSETREIPRDRRVPKNRYEETQARMSAPPDQLDFNRFTEDSYDSYESYAASLENSPPEPVSNEPKIKLPSVSIESLWQDYLKFPVIGLGVIGGAFLLYSVASRPIFDLGLRFGIFKDARGMDFTKADFSGAKLAGADFSQANLTNAKMQDADLTGANFQNANLNGADFANADMSRSRLVGASVIWSNFTNAQMNLVDFTGANITRSNFMSAKMNGANLKGTKIGAIGTENATKLSPTVLLAWQIVNEPREGRNLSNQDLSTLNLSSSNLRRANLTNVKLNYSDMSGANLSGANLSGAQVNGTNWNDAKLNGANLSDLKFDPKQLPKTNENTICPNNKPGPCKF